MPERSISSLSIEEVDTIKLDRNQKSQDPQESQDHQGSQDPQESQDSQDPQESQDSQDPTEYSPVLLVLADLSNETYYRVAKEVDLVSITQNEESERRYELSPEQIETLISLIKLRFENPPSHYSKAMLKLKKRISWTEVEKVLRSADAKNLWSLNELEQSGGAVDLRADEGDGLRFGDCSQESPSNRRNQNYYQAMSQAKDMGVEIDDINLYRLMHKLGKFDTNTCSWLRTDVKTEETGLAFYGHCFGFIVNVEKSIASNQVNYKAWRGSISIKKHFSS